MKKLLKPANLLFNLLMLLAFFLVGLLFAKWIDAGKGQMLAGGAIVLGYGVLFAGIAFIASFFIAYYAKHRAIVWANVALSVLLVTCFLYFRMQYQKRRQSQSIEQKERPMKPTAPADNEKILALAKVPKITSRPTKKEPGLGFFTPNFHQRPILYFYGNINLEKSVMEHSPTDSIVFKPLEHGGFDIAEAPPWLVPEHMKLDYDLLYFQMVSLGREFVEVVVNTQTRQTAFVNKYDGKVMLWPEFLLKVHSVELPLDSKEKVRARPFEQAGEINTPYAFLRPILIKGDWMQVELWNDDFKKVGKGWIHWRHNENLLISYSLLS